jgi:small subunit ribosomal protein S17
MASEEKNEPTEAVADEAGGPKAAGETAPKRRRTARPKVTKPEAAKPEKAPATTTRRKTERKPIVRAPKPERERGRRKERRGVVVSDAMDKTIVVRVDTVRPHRSYKKVVRRSRKVHAHDEQNAAGIGDVVRIVESRPISKTKHWRLAEIIEVAQ